MLPTFDLLNARFKATASIEKKYTTKQVNSRCFETVGESSQTSITSQLIGKRVKMCYKTQFLGKYHQNLMLTIRNIDFQVQSNTNVELNFTEILMSVCRYKSIVYSPDSYRNNFFILIYRVELLNDDQWWPLGSRQPISTRWIWSDAPERL